jgi:hypothetical protein
VLDIKLCNKVCPLPTAGQWFSLGNPVSSTNKTDGHNIAEIFFKVALNTINPDLSLSLLEGSQLIKKML